MMLDLIDAAFMGRQRTVPAPAATPAPELPPTRAEPRASARPAAAPAVTRGWRPPLPAGVAAAPRELVGRLLDEAAAEWDGLATHVEAARRRGRRVIAVAGSEAREGRSTLVACLTATLEARGGDVVCIDSHDVAAAVAGGHGPSHDRRIVLVDAGVWFPPGPIRRPWLIVASLGCEAAILVSRGRGRSDARAAALEAIGIEVLGEVLTFAPALDTPHA
jgi:hypothetical protein